MLTRSRGDFDEILDGSDLIVELIGGLEPARDYVLRAMRAGKHVVSANKQLLAHHGEELWAAAREHGVQLRFEGAVAGVVPVIRVLRSRSRPRTWNASTGSSTARRTSSCPRWRVRASPTTQALAQAQELGYAEADPTDDVDGQGRRRQDGDPGAAGVRHAGSARPGPATRASSTSPPTTWPTRASSGSG